LTIIVPSTEDSMPLGSLCDIAVRNVPDPRPETPAESTIGRQRLRQAVVGRDLPWLLNAPALETWCDLTLFPEVRRSVLNFGIPALSGRAVAGLDPKQIRALFQEAIAAFEPRLRNVRITEEPGAKAELNPLLRYRIEAVLWADPDPLPLVL